MLLTACEPDRVLCHIKISETLGSAFGFDTEKIRCEMASKAATRTVKQVKPILSLDPAEARQRVLNLYKAWHRQLPYIVKQYDIPKTVEQCRDKLREEFTKYNNIQDIRLIDMMVIKGQMELKEVVNMWKQKGHVMTYFKDTVEPKPKDFLSKFLSGKD